ncbi:MAG: hypothetical protein ACLGHL_07360 [Actinomycetota bacterium]
MDVIWIGIGLVLIVVLAGRLIRNNLHREQRSLESLREVVEGKKIESDHRSERSAGS